LAFLKDHQLLVGGFQHPVVRLSRLFGVSINLCLLLLVIKDLAGQVLTVIEALLFLLELDNVLMLLLLVL